MGSVYGMYQKASIPGLAGKGRGARQRDKRRRRAAEKKAALEDDSLASSDSATSNQPIIPNIAEVNDLATIVSEVSTDFV